jgi:hypothetical protein
MMEALNGLLFINNQDVYVNYGAYLAEEKQGDHKNYDSLMKPSKTKATTAVDFREENGEKYPDTLLVTSEARDITLRFAVIATGKTAFLQQYQDFIGLLKNGNNGWLNIRFPELDITFRVFYKESSGYEQLTFFDDGDVGAIITVKFREPQPTF